MILALRIVLGLVAMICFLGGLNIMLKGANGFLPKDIAPQLVLDNLLRFLSGIYFGSGILFIYSLINVESLGSFIYCMGCVVCFSGLGRLYSRIKVGSAGMYFDIIMLVEVLLGLIIILLEYIR
ncbi:MAG TPA: DUF4345 domain-containing protein [Candidatus Kapabacteria bacterium]|nr:DUF4345 domain-containing protein [Candidatus Kapabacteria bacterium]